MSCDFIIECVGSKCASCRRVDDKIRHDELASERAAGFLACKAVILAHFKKIWAPGVYAELKRNVEEACK